MDLSTRFWGIKYSVCGIYSPEPPAEVHRLQLNFKILKLVYSRGNQINIAQITILQLLFTNQGKSNVGF